MAAAAVTLAAELWLVTEAVGRETEVEQVLVEDIHRDHPSTVQASQVVFAQCEGLGCVAASEQVRAVAIQPGPAKVQPWRFTFESQTSSVLVVVSRHRGRSVRYC